MLVTRKLNISLLPKNVVLNPKDGATRIGDVLLVDVPGTYSLEAHSPEEEVARDYISCLLELK